MVVFIDTSAWVKYFIEESGSFELQRFILARSKLGTDRFAASAVTYAEMHATLRRALQGGRIPKQQYQEAVTAFEGQWHTVDAPGVDLRLVKVSGELARRHSLKGCDAFQLASALALDADVLINSDHDLGRAAARYDLTVWICGACPAARRIVDLVRVIGMSSRKSTRQTPRSSCLRRWTINP